MLRKLLVAILLGLVMVSPVFAQSSLETFTSEDGRVTFDYPRGWFVTEGPNSINVVTNPDIQMGEANAIEAGQGGFSLIVANQAEPSSLLRVLSGATAVEKLQFFIDRSQSLIANLGEVEAITIGEHPAAQSSGSYNGNNNDLSLIVVDFENGGYGFIIIETAPGALSRLEPKLLSILNTVSYAAPPEADTNIKLGSLVPINPTNAANLERLSLLDEGSGSATTVAASPDAALIASGSAFGAIRLWDTATGQQITSPKDQSAGIQQLLFTPDGERLISAGNDGTVRVWDVTNGEQQDMAQQDGSIWYMALSPDGSQLAYISYVATRTQFVSSTVWLWNLETGDEQKVTDMPADYFANSIAFSPDGELVLYSASSATSIQVGLYDAATLREINTWSGEGNPIDVFFTADSQPIISKTANQDEFDVSLWNPQTDSSDLTLIGHQLSVYQTMPNPSRTILGTPSFDGTTRLWNLKNGDLLKTLEHHASVIGIAFSTDERLLVTSDSGGEIYVWGITANI